MATARRIVWLNVITVVSAAILIFAADYLLTSAFTHK